MKTSMELSWGTWGLRAAVTVETRDISLVGRIVASFPEYLTEE